MEQDTNARYQDAVTGRNAEDATAKNPEPPIQGDYPLYGAAPATISDVYRIVNESLDQLRLPEIVPAELASMDIGLHDAARVILVERFNADGMADSVNQEVSKLSQTEYVDTIQYQVTSGNGVNRYSAMIIVRRKPDARDDE